MRKIKFRGKNIKTGKFVYGGIIQDEKQSIIVNIYLDDEGYPCPDYVEVAPDSVAQFVGYDRNGKEFYSDDKLREYDSFDYCEGIMPADESFYFYEIGKTFKSLELVEEK